MRSRFAALLAALALTLSSVIAIPGTASAAAPVYWVCSTYHYPGLYIRTADVFRAVYLRSAGFTCTKMYRV